MANLPASARPDLPMMHPGPSFPHSAPYLPPGGGDNSLMIQNKVGVHGGSGGGRGGLPGGGGTMLNTISPTTESLQMISSNSGMSKTADNAEAVDPTRLKQWSNEETLELIGLYKKYLPQFHRSGQRKMTVWQQVTAEMVAKGYGNFSWAECSAKFRSLRDSYRRSPPGWPFHVQLKEVMKMEKMILEQETHHPPATLRGPKPTITCENDMRNPSSAPFANVNLPAGNVPSSSLSNAPVSNSLLSNTQLPCTPQNVVGGQGIEMDSEAGRRCSGGSKRTLSETDGVTSAAAAAKKPKESDHQDTEVVVVGRNFNGEPVKAKSKKPAAGPMGVLGSLQALGKSLALPQSQLVVSDDGQIVQTTSAPTGLYVSENGQLCSSSQHASQGRPAPVATSMPQWFKMYEKRTRAENGRRLEELKEMHRESLELQRQTLEVAQQKNQLLKNLMESLAEFKSLLQK